MANVRALLAAVLVMIAGPTAAQDAQQVDLNLVLAVDVSVSMSGNELDIQRAGYAAALKDPSVLQAIQSGPNGRIAVAYFEWAGVTSQQTVVPWTIVGNADDAAAVAAKLDRVPTWQPRRTSISGALDFAAVLLAKSPFKAARNVIDISGDGTNNEGRPVTEARDAAVARNITVNGLPLMADLEGSRTDVQRLDEYYDRCVTGGPGSFVIAVGDWAEFPTAIRRKFLLEIAGGPQRAPERLPVVLAQAKPGYDCLIGERQYLDDPMRNQTNPEKFQWPNNRPENWRKWK